MKDFGGLLEGLSEPDQLLPLWRLRGKSVDSSFHLAQRIQGLSIRARRLRRRSLPFQFIELFLDLLLKILGMLTRESLG